MSELGERKVSMQRYGQTSDMGSDAGVRKHTTTDCLTGYINAGGRGTRLRSIFAARSDKGVPKALLPIGQPPIYLIEHQINKLASARVPTIVAGVGDHKVVADLIETTYGSKFNVHSVYYSNQLGNGGDLVRAIRDRPELFGKYILITCVDVLLDIDEVELLAFHQDKGGELSIALTLNTGVPNEGAYYVGQDDEVMHCAEASEDSAPPSWTAEGHTYRGSSTGALIANTELLRNLEWQPADGSFSIYDELVATSMRKSSMFAFNNGERLFTDIGTVASWEKAQADHDMIAPYIHYTI